MAQTASENRPMSLGSLYRLATRLYSAAPYHWSTQGKAFPAWHYFFEVTRRCNLRCAMCQYLEWYRQNSPEQQREGELTTEEWLRLIDETVPYGLITFTGGEPWVREDFVTLLEHAARKRRVHFITNGTRLSDENAALCARLAPKTPMGKGLAFAGFSLEGPRDLHDKLTAEGAFDRTLAAMRALTRAREKLGKQCPLIHVTAVIQNANLDALPELPALIAKAGANVLNLAIEMCIPSVPGVGATDPDTLTIDLARLPRIERAALTRCLDATRAAADRAGIGLRLPTMPREELLQYYDGGLDLRRFECRSPWTNFMIGCKGDAYACLPGKVGNVREQSMRELWNGPRMRALRNRLKKGVYCICQGCCELEYRGATSRPAP